MVSAGVLSKYVRVKIGNEDRKCWMGNGKTEIWKGKPLPPTAATQTLTGCTHSPHKFSETFRWWYDFIIEIHGILNKTLHCFDCATRTLFEFTQKIYFIYIYKYIYIDSRRICSSGLRKICVGKSGQQVGKSCNIVMWKSLEQVKYFD